MKDDSFWIVVEEGRMISDGIRCDGGKSEAQELRKDMEASTRRRWKAMKVTKKEFAEMAKA